MMGKLPTSEKQRLIPKPSFYIRPAMQGDATAMLSIDKHVVQHSLNAIPDFAAPLSAIEASILNPDTPDLVYLVAASSTLGLGVNRAPSATVFTREVAYHTDKDVEEDLTASSADESVISAPFHGLLGYIILGPFTGSAKGPKACFKRTASMALVTPIDTALGAELHRAVTAALIDEAFSRCQERGDRYKTLVTETSFKDDQPVLQARRDLLLENGFKQVRMLKEVIEKNGLLLNLMFSQRLM